jgi:hypothetical protein
VVTGFGWLDAPHAGQDRAKYETASPQFLHVPDGIAVLRTITVPG